MAHTKRLHLLLFPAKDRVGSFNGAPSLVYSRKRRATRRTPLDHGSPFTWSQGESLEELAQPERIAQIREEHQKRLERMRGKLQVNPLRPDSEPIDIDDLYGQAKVCLACHK